jgi:tetratricopeptide (TPR) repeat protein
MKKGLSIGILLFSVMLVHGQDAAEKINRANEALTSQDWATAFTLYDEAMNNLGDVQVDESINFNIGYAGYKAGRFSEAVEYLDKAIEVGANVSKAWEYKAICFNELEDYAKAVESFEKAAETSEDGGAASIYNGAIAAYKGNMLDKAVELFSQSVASDYKGETAQYYKAVVYNKQGNEAAYKQALMEGVEKFPGDERLSQALAKEYVSEGNTLYKKGVAVLNAANQKVNEGTLKTTDAAYTAEVEKAKTEFKAAADILEKAVQLDASNQNAELLLDACKQNLAI